MTGLAQKGGSVYTHIRIASQPEEIHAVRIAAGEADAVLGCDMIVAASDEGDCQDAERIYEAVINGDISPTGGFPQNPDMQIPKSDMEAAIREAVGVDAVEFVDATGLASSLIGDSIATNLSWWATLAERPDPTGCDIHPARY